MAKTANNILLWACIRADVEALRLGRALGVEPAKLREAMAIGSGANRPLAEWGKHRLRWPHKDLEVALAVAAEAVVRVGDVGAGQVAKTANNILLWACIRADVEALRLGRALGVEPAALREAMAIGSGANRPLAEWGKHRLRWPHKDLEVALAIAGDAGVEIPLVARLAELMEELTVDDLRDVL